MVGYAEDLRVTGGDVGFRREEDATRGTNPDGVWFSTIGAREACRGGGGSIEFTESSCRNVKGASVEVEAGAERCARPRGAIADRFVAAIISAAVEAGAIGAGAKGLECRRRGVELRAELDPSADVLLRVEAVEIDARRTSSNSHPSPVSSLHCTPNPFFFFGEFRIIGSFRGWKRTFFLGERRVNEVVDETCLIGEAIAPDALDPVPNKAAREDFDSE